MTITINSKLIPAPKGLLSRKEAAELLNVKPQTLAVWATAKRYDLPYIKVGKSVKYRFSDIEAYLQRHTNLG